MAASDYETAVLADTPKTFHKMQDASGSPVDSSGNGLDITTVGGTPLYQEDGPMAGAVSIRLPTDASLTRAAVSSVVDNFTIEVWISTLDIVGINRGVWNQYGVLSDRSAAANGYGLIVNTNKKFQTVRQGIGFNTESAGTLKLPVLGQNLLPILGVGGGSPTQGGWDYVVVTRDAGTWKYYLNGAVDTSNAGTLAPAAPATSGPYTALLDISQPVRTWDFKVAYAAFYETALSSTRVTAHYDAAFV